MTATLPESPRTAAELPATTDLEQGVIEEARRRQRGRRLRVAAAVAVAVIGIAGIVAANMGGGSNRSSRQGYVKRPSVARTRAAASGSGGVRLAPALEGGSYGWEVIEDGGSTCCTTPVRGNALIGGMTVEPTAERERLTFLAGPEITAVLVNGHLRVPVVALPGHLPFHLRLVQVNIPRARGGAAANPGTPPSPGSRGAPPSPGITPSLIAVDSHGRTIPSVVPAHPARAIRWWERPSAAPPGPCQLRSTGLEGLIPEWGHVASAIVPDRAPIIGRAFFSCIDTEYYLHGWPLRAAILLDAAHPGSAPAAIPGLRPIPGERGLLDGLGPPAEDGLTARRTGNAWLVVAGGSGPAQRIEVLRHLTVSIAGTLVPFT